MFRLAGQRPSVDKLVYIPKPGESREWTHPVLKPGMDGFNGPPTLEPIRPYNPNEDKSGFIQLAEWKENPQGSAPPGSYRVPQWTPSGYKGDPSLIDLEYDPTAPSFTINGPKLTEPIPTYTPQSPEDVIASRSGLVGTQFDIVSGEGGSPYEPYKFPRPEIPQPTPRPTPPAPKARMAGLSEAIAAIVKALS